MAIQNSYFEKKPRSQTFRAWLASRKGLPARDSVESNI